MNRAYQRSSIVESKVNPAFGDVFRRGCSYLPTGVAIVAALDATRTPFGLTVSSVLPVSFDPPLISICVAAASSRLSQLEQAGYYSINLLRENQADQALQVPGAAAWDMTDPGAPVLDGALAHFHCALSQVVDAGDHKLVLGEAVRLAIHGGEPLVYWRRGFCGLHLEYPFLASESELERFVEGWRTGTLPKREGTHAAHIAIGAYHLFDHRTDDAFEHVKAGIVHFNSCVGTANTEDSGYHETLTRFWILTLEEFQRGRERGSRFEAVREAVEVFGQDRDRHRLSYSFDVVRDRRARRESIAPDRAWATIG